jgi:hypothetical protein
MMGEFYMRVKLKTLEQLEKEFKPYADIWEHGKTLLYIEIFGLKWNINADMLSKLGTFINVERFEFPKKTYTHYGDGYWNYHESWFEPELEDFFKEEEFKI